MASERSMIAHLKDRIETSERALENTEAEMAHLRSENARLATDNAEMERRVGKGLNVRQALARDIVCADLSCERAFDPAADTYAMLIAATCDWILSMKQPNVVHPLTDPAAVVDAAAAKAVENLKKKRGASVEAAS